MDTAYLFLQLFATFFVIGVFTFGGGYAMLSLIQTQVVTLHHWLTEPAFTNILILPSFMIVLLMVKFYEKFMGHPLFNGVMSGLRPAVAGLIGAAAVILVFHISWTGLTPHFEVIRDNFPDWKSWVLFGAAMVASLAFKVSPILIIVLGGVAGLLLY